MTTFLWVWLVVLAYRLVPYLVESVAGMLFVPEAVRRGFIANGQALIAESQIRFTEVWPRWVSQNVRTIRVPALVWVDAHVLLVWPWLWPIWLGPKLGVQHRVFHKMMDHWWRVK